MKRFGLVVGIAMLLFYSIAQAQFVGPGERSRPRNWVTGDCSYSPILHAFTCTKTNNVPFGPFATQTAPCSVAQGCTNQTTAPLARTSSGLNVWSSTSHGDSNYAIASTDRTVYHTALSTARTDTLPAASSMNPGEPIIVSDLAGVASASNTITLQRSGSDTINGVTSFVAINAQYGSVIIWSDGVSKWSYLVPGAGGGGAGVTQVACGSGLSGGTITTTGTCTVAGAWMPVNQTFGGL